MVAQRQTADVGVGRERVAVEAYVRGYGGGAEGDVGLFPDDVADDQAVAILLRVDRLGLLFGLFDGEVALLP